MTEKNEENEVRRSKSRDTLFDGKLICWQHKNGYRFSIDSVLLGHFARIKKNESILDLGCGSGIIGLILLYRHHDKKISVTGYEKQLDLVCLTKLNISENQFSKVFKVISGDITEIKQNISDESFSTVISNPPFYSSGSGRISFNSESATARHQSASSLESFVRGAAYSVKNKGKVVVVFPAESLTSLLNTLKYSKLEPKRIQFIYSYPSGKSGAKLVLVESVKNGGPGLIVNPPQYIYLSKNGQYSEEIALMYKS